MTATSSWRPPSGGVSLGISTGPTRLLSDRARLFSDPIRLPTSGHAVSLHETIETDLREAMKARDKPRTSALRMVVAALKNKAVAEGLSPQGRLDDEVVERVLSVELKRRKEAAAAFREGGRMDSALSEEAEAEVYAAYLPEQMTDDELRSLVEDAVAETGAEGPQQMGQVMKATMAKVQGRAEGGRVSAIVKARLAR